MKEAGQRNISGNWNGIYNYPRHFPPVQFEAQIDDQNGALRGTTTEINRKDQREVPAQLVGTVSGSIVEFTKFYDDMPSSGHDTILYKGTLSPDGDEITGTWQLPGNWSGTFIMIRPVAQAAETKRALEAPIERR